MYDSVDIVEARTALGWFFFRKVVWTRGVSNEVQSWSLNTGWNVFLKSYDYPEEYHLGIHGILMGRPKVLRPWCPPVPQDFHVRQLTLPSSGAKETK